MLVWLVLTAWALCGALMPTLIAVSPRIGAMDVPRDWRRMHVRPTPRAGGLGIYASFAICVLAWQTPSQSLLCVLAGSGLLMTVGLADDILDLPAWSKLFFQISITTATVQGCGLCTSKMAPVAVLWVLTLTNAHNFVDGLDGLFAGCAAIECGLLFLALLLRKEAAWAGYALLLGGACVGFLGFNRHPARIFAGDCGSGTVGFLLGLLSLPLLLRAEGRTEVLSPLFLFGYPLTELGTSVMRRLLRGVSPFAADRAHLHHRITAAGVRQKQCAAILHGITVSLGVIGVLLADARFYAAASVACLISVGALMYFRQMIVQIAEGREKTRRFVWRFLG